MPTLVQLIKPYILGLILLFKGCNTSVASNIVFICFFFQVNRKWIQVKLNDDDLNVLPFIGLAVAMSVLILILTIIIAILSCLICRYI